MQFLFSFIINDNFAHLNQSNNYLCSSVKPLLFFFLILCHFTYAQSDPYTQKTDSVKAAFVLPLTKADSATALANQKIDSVTHQFSKQIDSLQQAYHSAKTNITTLQNGYQQKVDSLNARNLPTEKYTAKVDSLQAELTSLQHKATKGIDSLKQNVSAKIKLLKLPPEANAKVSALSASLDKINFQSMDAGALPSLEFGQFNLPLSGISQPDINGLSSIKDVSENIPALNNPSLQDNLGKVSELSAQAGEIQEQVKAGNVTGAIEDKAAQLDEVKAIQQQALPTMPELPAELPTSSDEAKEVLVEQAKKAAVNHFAGKEAALQQAMDKMSKYKNKYSNVQSIKDLPKKAPNEMKEKPFVERLVEGVSLQFFRDDNFKMDFTPYLGYRFTTRLTAGAGWNQRIIFGDHNSHRKNVYGPRVYGEYNVFKGFFGRLEVETMNAFVRQNLQSEAGHREWVPAILAGIKKDYKIYGRLKGTAFLLYNCYNPNYKSPYGDRLNVRMGFEYSIKKRVGN